MNGIDNRRIVSHWDERRQRKGFPPAALEARAAIDALATNEKATKVATYIRAAYRATGNFPSVREIAEVIDLSSTSVVTHYLRLLEKRGVIVKTGGKYSHYTLPEVLEALKSL